MKRYVAVVTKQLEYAHSLRKYGDWACFVADSKELAVDKALKARTRREANGVYGPYDIFVGELTEKVETPLAYKLVKFVPEGADDEKTADVSRRSSSYQRSTESTLEETKEIQQPPSDDIPF